MLNLIIALLISIGAITSADQATEQVIKENKTEIQAVIGDDFDEF